MKRVCEFSKKVNEWLLSESPSSRLYVKCTFWPIVFQHLRFLLYDTKCERKICRQSLPAQYVHLISELDLISQKYRISFYSILNWNGFHTLIGFWQQCADAFAAHRITHIVLHIPRNASLSTDTRLPFPTKSIHDLNDDLYLKLPKLGMRRTCYCRWICFNFFEFDTFTATIRICFEMRAHKTVWFDRYMNIHLILLHLEFYKSIRIVVLNLSICLWHIYYIRMCYSIKTSKCVSVCLSIKIMSVLVVFLKPNSLRFTDGAKC